MSASHMSAKGKTLYKLILLFSIFILVLSCAKNNSDSTFAVIESNSNSNNSENNSETTETTKSPWALDKDNGWNKLTSPSRNAQGYFGNGMAVGDFNNDNVMDIAVGAYASDLSENSNGATNTGGVFVYYSVGSSTAPKSRGDADLFLSANTSFNSSYGMALHSQDINNDGYDDLLVGAPLDDRAGTDTGSIYIYLGSNNGIEKAPYQVITQPGNTANSSFGSAVTTADLDGDGYLELIVGSMYDDSGGTDRGSVWIIKGQSNYIYDTAGAVEIRDSTAANTEYCGTAVWVHDYNDDDILDIYMGCPNEDTGGADRGKIWIFHGTGVSGSWVNSTTTPDVGIANPVGANTDYFGTAIAVFDYDNDGSDDLIVGATAADDGWTGSGSLYIWNDIQNDTTVDLIVGPSYSDVNLSSAYYGASISIADLNGDGNKDLIVGSPLSDLFGYYTGRVSIMFGVSTGSIDFLNEDKNIYYDYHKSGEIYERKNSENLFGTAICQMDFNKDGKKDLIVGAQHDDSKYTDDGAVFVYYQQSDGSVLNNPDQRLFAPGIYNTAKEFGSSCLGMDINNDGHEDLLIGAWEDDTLVTNGGAVYVFYGTSTGTQTTSGIAFYGPNTTNYNFGSSLAKGDLDNDGYDDLIVGAAYADIGGTDRGAVYVFRSNSTTGVIDKNTYTQFTHTGPANSDYLGKSVLAFDIDGDGDQDLLAGAPGDDGTASASGMVYVWYNGTDGTNAGTNTLIETTSDATIASPLGATNQAFGSALASGKSSNKNYPDLFVGAAEDDIQGTDSGVVYIYKGTADGYDTNATNYFTFSEASFDIDELFGYSILIFDFDGNGTNDILVGAPEDDDPGSQSGSVFIEFK